MTSEVGSGYEPQHPEPFIGASRWDIDPAQSEIRFSIRQLMINTVKGQFERMRGYVGFDEVHRTPVLVEVEIDAASITTGMEQRDIHLRSGDFFDVETHPNILFVSRSFESEGRDHYRITGDLRLHGVTREVVLDATFEGIERDPWGHERAAFRGTTQINRHDFGLNWNRAIEAGGMMVGDTVRISLDIQAVKRDENGQ